MSLTIEPDVTVSIAGRDRWLVAAALIEAIKDYEQRAREARPSRARNPAYGIKGRLQEQADRLRAIYDQVVL